MDVLLVTSTPELANVAALLSGAGLEVVSVDSTEEALQRVGTGPLVVVILGAGSDAVAPLNNLSSQVRRRLVVVQVGDDVTTADGASAFMRGVNLVVADGDVGHLPDLIPRAVQRHRELVGLLEPELLS